MDWCYVIFITFFCSCTSGTARDEALQDRIKIVPLVPVPDDLEGNYNDSESNTRIIGGTDTTIERFPFVVQVMYDRSLACGGSLITRRHVLSAAHCFFDQVGRPVSPARYSIRVGTALLESGGSTYSISTYIVHERYDVPVVRDNDVAVMVLSSRVSLSRLVALASLPPQGVELPDNSVVVQVGWGRTNQHISRPSQILQEVSIRTINFSICTERYNYLSEISSSQFVITTGMLCSGLLDIGGADGCQGDSGGPVIYRNIVVGVTSWGYSCADARFPGVNAKVSAYTDWINQTVTRFSAGPPSTLTSMFLITTSILVSVFTNS